MKTYIHRDSRQAYSQEASRDRLFSRRAFIGGAVSVAFVPTALGQVRTSELEIITAPSNLGLRPPAPGHEPGTWGAPQALLEAGLLQSLAPVRMHSLARPIYGFEPQAGTRVRNGLTLRRFSEELAREVAEVLSRGVFPLVLGGDCSILLGCLLGARQAGVCGLIHVDGHSDFTHPGNYDPASRLGSAAGMDLALATGRGEPLLANWGPHLTPLVADEHVVQIGERENRDASYAYPDIRQTHIRRIDARMVLAQGVEATARQAIERLEAEHLDRAWLHVDVDVLDQKVMPAVDSPGSPGLNVDQLASLVRYLRASARIIGADISVFDPELDPDGRYAHQLAQGLAYAFGPL
jgi:arginase